MIGKVHKESPENLPEINQIGKLALTWIFGRWAIWENTINCKFHYNFKIILTQTLTINASKWLQSFSRFPAAYVGVFHSNIACTTWTNTKLGHFLSFYHMRADIHKFKTSLQQKLKTFAWNSPRMNPWQWRSGWRSKAATWKICINSGAFFKRQTAALSWGKTMAFKRIEDTSVTAPHFVSFSETMPPVIFQLLHLSWSPIWVSSWIFKISLNNVKKPQKRTAI